MEAFDQQMKNSIHLLDEEISTILKSETQIKSHLIELELEMINNRNRFDYVLVKLQHLSAINGML